MEHIIYADQGKKNNSKKFGYVSCKTKKNYKGETVEDFSQVTNFLLSPNCAVIGEHNVEYHVNLNTESNKYDMIFDGSDFVTAKAFKTKLSKKHMPVSFLGSDNDLELIKAELIQNTTNTKKGLDYVGLVEDGEKWKYIDKKSGDDKHVVTDKVFCDQSFNNELPTPEEMKELSNHLFSFGSDDVVYTILSSLTSCFTKPLFEKLELRSPIISLTGEAGGGKSTTLESVFLPAFNNLVPEIAGSVTKFGALKKQSESNIFPYVLEEYKEHKMPQQVINLVSLLIRSNYNGHLATRGKADQSYNEFVLRSPMVIVGETELEETALKERILCIAFSKLGRTKSSEIAMNWLKGNKNIMAKVGNLLLKEVLEANPEILRSNFDSSLNKISDCGFPSRLKESIAVASSSYKLLVNAFDKYGIKIRSNVTKLIELSQKKFNLNGETKARTEVENTLEIISTMIERGLLRRNEEYTINKDGNFCLLMKTSYDILTKYVKEHSIKANINSTRNNFLRHLEKTLYYVANKTVRPTSLDGGNVTHWSPHSQLKKDSKRCIVFDMKELAKIDFCLAEDLKEENKNPNEGEKIDIFTKLDNEKKNNNTNTQISIT